MPQHRVSNQPTNQPTTLVPAFTAEEQELLSSWFHRVPLAKQQPLAGRKHLGQSGRHQRVFRKLPQTPPAAYTCKTPRIQVGH